MLVVETAARYDDRLRAPSSLQRGRHQVIALLPPLLPATVGFAVFVRVFVRRIVVVLGGPLAREVVRLIDRFFAAVGSSPRTSFSPPDPFTYWP